MKKLILICLLIIGMLLVGCTTENVVDDEMQDITEDDLAALPEDVAVDNDGALVGNAKWYNCEDNDSTTTYSKDSLATVGTTTYDGGSYTDRCYTWYAGTPNAKTRLLEGTCYNGKFRYWYADCSRLGEGYECVNDNPNGGWGNQGQEGHCVLVEEESYCEDSDGGINGDVFGEVNTNSLVAGSDSPTADMCVGNQVREMYCNVLNQGAPKLVDCDNGCEDGACAQEDFVCEDSYSLFLNTSELYYFANSTYNVTFYDALYQAYAGGIHQANFYVNGEDLSINEGESKSLAGGTQIHLEALLQLSEGLQANFCFSDSE